MKRQKYLLLNQLKKEDIIIDLKDCNAIIAGGSIASIFSEQKIKDYDVYFRNKEDFQKMFNILSNKKDIRLVYTTDCAETFKSENIIVQLIKIEKLMGEPEDIINKFDYSVCMGAYDFKFDSFTLNKNFLKDLAARRLIFNINSNYPLASLYRMKKYINKGYNISGGEIIKLGLSINNLRLETYSDLKEQLQGVDTLILKELTDVLMSDEYKNKKYNFEDFMTLINEYLDKVEDILI